MNIRLLYVAIIAGGLSSLVKAAGVARPHADPANLKSLLAQTQREAAAEVASHPPGTKVYGEYAPRNGAPNANETIFQGDITEAVLPNLNGLGFDVVRNRAALWPGGRVPYQMSNSFTPAQKNLIRIAIDEFKRQTCIQFVPKTDSDEDYVKFWKLNYLSACSSAAGKAGGEQKINYAAICFAQLGKIMHEMMHAVGFYHEQARPDRDQYVFIDFKNVLPGENYVRQFDKIPEEMIDTQNLDYDYASLMHYDRFGFAKNKSAPVITNLKPLPEGLKDIGQRDYFSELDIIKLNKLYNCAGKVGQQCTADELACTGNGGSGEICARKCDGIAQCADGSDETNCPRPTCTDPDFWPCKVTKCIPKSWLCDTKHDCLGGEDELPENCQQTKCQPNTEFKCRNGKCIQSFRLCDGVRDCLNGEDEDQRTCSARQQPQTPSEQQFNPFFSLLYNPCGDGFNLKHDFGLLSFFGAPICVPDGSNGFFNDPINSNAKRAPQRHCFIDVSSLWQRSEIQVTLDALSKLLTTNNDADGSSPCEVIALGYANVVVGSNGDVSVKLPAPANDLLKLLQKAKEAKNINGFVLVINSANELRAIGSDLTKARKFGEAVRSELRKLNATGILLEWLRPLPSDKAALNTLLKTMAEAMQYDPDLKTPKFNGVRLLIGLNVLPAIKAAHDKDLILKNADYLNVIPDTREELVGKRTAFANRLLSDLANEKTRQNTWLSSDNNTLRRINVGIRLAPMTWTLSKFQNGVGGQVQSSGVGGPLSGSPGALNTAEMCIIGDAKRATDFGGRALKSLAFQSADRNANVYATSGAERQWIAYESPESMLQKLRSVQTALQSLNGLYIMDLQADDPRGLCGASNSFALTKAVLKFSTSISDQI